MHLLKDDVPVSFDGIPCPFNYASILQKTSLIFWERVTSLSDVKVGDVFIFLRPNFTPLTEPTDTNRRTGTHMVIVDEVCPKNSDNHSFTVIDCTRKAHCEDDTRYAKKNGIGRAPLSLIPAGNYFRLRWGNSRNSYRKEVTIGRFREPRQERAE